METKKIMKMGRILVKMVKILVEKEIIPMKMKGFLLRKFQKKNHGYGWHPQGPLLLHVGLIYIAGRDLCQQKFTMESGRQQTQSTTTIFSSNGIIFVFLKIIVIEHIRCLCLWMSTTVTQF